MTSRIPQKQSENTLFFDQDSMTRQFKDSHEKILDNFWSLKLIVCICATLLACIFIKAQLFHNQAEQIQMNKMFQEIKSQQTEIQNLKRQFPLFEYQIFEDLKNLYMQQRKFTVADFGQCTYSENLKQSVEDIQCYNGNIKPFSILRYGKFIDLSTAQSPKKPIADWVQVIGICHRDPLIKMENYIRSLAKYVDQGIVISLKGTPKDCKEITSQQVKMIIEVLSTAGLAHTQTIKGYLMIFKYFMGAPSQRGFFVGSKGLKDQHYYSDQLFKILSGHYTAMNAKSIVDFGGGICTYAEKLADLGFSMECYDGNPATPEVTKFGKVLDLSEPQNLGRQFDWVQSFEVGEHLQPNKSQTFVDTLTKHAKDGIIMSWAVIGQGGFSHINQKSSEDVINMVEARGFKYNEELTLKYRGEFMEKIYFKYTLLVFNRIA